MSARFLCPQCGAKGLKIVRSMTLPSNERFDDVILQVTECNSCSFRGIALYEESRRGAMDSECWEHTGFWVMEPALTAVEDILNQCADSHNALCGCDGHRAAVDAVARGKTQRLAILDEFGCEQTFPMRY